MLSYSFSKKFLFSLLFPVILPTQILYFNLLKNNSLREQKMKDDTEQPKLKRKKTAKALRAKINEAPARKFAELPEEEDDDDLTWFYIIGGRYRGLW